MLAHKKSYRGSPMKISILLSIALITFTSGGVQAQTPNGSDPISDCYINSSDNEHVLEGCIESVNSSPSSQTSNSVTDPANSSYDTMGSEKGFSEVIQGK